MKNDDIKEKPTLPTVEPKVNAVLARNIMLNVPKKRKPVPPPSEWITRFGKKDLD